MFFLIAHPWISCNFCNILIKFILKWPFNYPYPPHRAITIRLRNRTSKYVSKSEENNNIRYFITRSKAENLFQKMTLQKRTAEICQNRQNCKNCQIVTQNDRIVKIVFSLFLPLCNSSWTGHPWYGVNIIIFEIWPKSTPKDIRNGQKSVLCT